MEKEQQIKKPYVSCIKINGVPILSPLINNELRSQLQKYKEQAIQLEEHYRKIRSVKINLNEILTFPHLTPRSDVSFQDNNSHIDNLGLDNTENFLRVPATCRNLSKDIIDITEYTDKGVKIIDDVCLYKNENFDDTESQNICFAEKCVSNDEIKSASSSSTPRPRLIRSNSYTIDTPSPMLLAHLEQQSNAEEKSPQKNFIFSRNWSSLENNYVPFDAANNTDENKLNQASKSPSIEVLQTDVIVQQITVNADMNDSSLATKELNETRTIDMTVDEDTETQLLKVLDRIPENYSSQILELIQKQKEEQQKRLECYERIKSQYLNNTPNGYVKGVPRNDVSYHSSTQLRINDSDRTKSSVGQSPSDDTFYTLSNSSVTVTMANSPIVKLIDLESDDCSDKDKSWLRNRSPNISKELFPKIEKTSERQMKEEWAASKIGAFAKGYLTRRFLKTDKVQSLIETIKETLMCALQLHDAENIDERDVELHRRLVQQVSAACYAFHDMFFSLSVQEQMMIIAADRQYKIEKAKRPLSAPSSGRRLTPSSSRSSFRSKSSITPSQSSTKV